MKLGLRKKGGKEKGVKKRVRPRARQEEDGGNQRGETGEEEAEEKQNGKKKKKQPEDSKKKGREGENKAVGVALKEEEF